MNDISHCDEQNVIPVIVSVRNVRNTGGGGANMDNLHHMSVGTKWDIPALLNVNARSLNIEKMDELISVADNNKVSCICVTETWFSEYVSNEAVSLPGYNCERHDRVGRRGGGTACYIKDSILYDRLTELDSDSHEVLWIKLMPKRLPRRFSCIVIGCLYHPPDADNEMMHDYLTTSIDCILRKYPECGLLLLGDFNHLKDGFIKLIKAVISW